MRNRWCWAGFGGIGSGPEGGWFRPRAARRCGRMLFAIFELRCKISSKIVGARKEPDYASY